MRHDPYFFISLTQVDDRWLDSKFLRLDVSIGKLENK